MTPETPNLRTKVERRRKAEWLYQRKRTLRRSVLLPHFLMLCISLLLATMAGNRFLGAMLTGLLTAIFVLTWFWLAYQADAQFSKAFEKCSQDDEQADALEALMIYQTAQGKQKKSLHDLLVRQLDRIDVSDKADWTEMHAGHLMRMARREDRFLASAAVRALGKIGGKSALPGLKRIAESKSNIAESIALAIQAREAIEAIELRLNERSPQQSLLRSSEKPDEPASLLRAAQSAHAEDNPMLLLRTSETKGDQ